MFSSPSLRRAGLAFTLGSAAAALAASVPPSAATDVASRAPSNRLHSVSEARIGVSLTYHDPALCPPPGPENVERLPACDLHRDAWLVDPRHGAARRIRENAEQLTTARGGAIAFVRYEATGEFPNDVLTPFVHVAAAPRSGARRLGIGEHPTWSPDGRRLAFQRLLPGSQEPAIFVVRRSGDGLRRLAAGREPAWSSRGAIAFTAGGGGCDGRIATIAPTGRRLRMLTRGPCDYTPSWSPDGDRLTFVREPSAIMVVGRDGRGLRRIHDLGFDPHWSPDGSRIAFTNRREVLTMRADGARVRRVLGFRDLNPSLGRRDGTVSLLVSGWH